ncbi:MAG: hypothetical protein RPU64_09450 [Candidatus Sedimenticola sp. (ex Thyasira tokunagai)]
MAKLLKRISAVNALNNGSSRELIGKELEQVGVSVDQFDQVLSAELLPEILDILEEHIGFLPDDVDQLKELLNKKSHPSSYCTENTKTTLMVTKNINSTIMNILSKLKDLTISTYEQHAKRHAGHKKNKEDAKKRYMFTQTLYLKFRKEKFGIKESREKANDECAIQFDRRYKYRRMIELFKDDHRPGIYPPDGSSIVQCN